jgi:hypothetical protein
MIDARSISYFMVRQRLVKTSMRYILYTFDRCSIATFQHIYFARNELLALRMDSPSMAGLNHRSYLPGSAFCRIQAAAMSAHNEEATVNANVVETARSYAALTITRVAGSSESTYVSDSRTRRTSCVL